MEWFQCLCSGSARCTHCQTFPVIRYPFQCIELAKDTIFVIVLFVFTTADMVPKVRPSSQRRVTAAGCHGKRRNCKQCQPCVSEFHCPTKCPEVFPSQCIEGGPSSGSCVPFQSLISTEKCILPLQPQQKKKRKSNPQLRLFWAHLATRVRKYLLYSDTETAWSQFCFNWTGKRRGSLGMNGWGLQATHDPWHFLLLSKQEYSLASRVSYGWVLLCLHVLSGSHVCSSKYFIWSYWNT